MGECLDVYFGGIEKKLLILFFGRDCTVIIKSGEFMDLVLYFFYILLFLLLRFSFTSGS